VVVVVLTMTMFGVVFVLMFILCISNL